jgi:hypothetical protein
MTFLTDYITQLKPGADLNQELDRMEDTEASPEIAELPRNDDDLQEGELVGRMKKLYVDPPQGRFFGKSRYFLAFPRRFFGFIYFQWLSARPDSPGH